MLKKPNPSETVLYSAPDSLESHTVRFIVAEKKINCEIVNVTFDKMPEELIIYNPTQTMPTLFDRDLILYDMIVIIEYLDERFPFPPMLPIDPIEKAEKRTLIYRFTRASNNWYQLTNDILSGSATANDSKKMLVNNLIELIPIFEYKRYFKNNSLGVVDACIAPVLWRLEQMNISLGSNTKPIIDYAERLFANESFQQSLTNYEKEIRK